MTNKITTEQAIEILKGDFTKIESSWDYRAEGLSTSDVFGIAYRMGMEALKLVSDEDIVVNVDETE